MARRYLKCDHTNAKVEKQYWCCLGKVGLKSVARLAWPNKTLTKLTVHRYHLNNFYQWRGPLREDEITYGIVDAWVSRAAVIEIARLLGLKWWMFIRTGRKGVLISGSLDRILSALSDCHVLAGLAGEEKEAATLLIALRQTKLGIYFVGVLNDLRRWFKKRECVMGQFRSQRDEIDYKQTIGGLRDIIYSLPLPQFLPKPVVNIIDEDAWQEEEDSSSTPAAAASG